MSIPLSSKVIDFAYTHTPKEEKINFGFFGGEPLLEFEKIKEITDIIESHKNYDSQRVELSIVSNGTILTDEICSFINKHDIGYVISCDGRPNVQDLNRRDKNGNSTSAIVEKNIRKAINAFKLVPVNAVYSPLTLKYLPDTVRYFSALGVRQIYLNPDFSAEWSKEDIESLDSVYNQIAKLYTNYYLKKEPHYISLFDGKIAVILRGGYKPIERCRMGKGEFAFTPDGRIYPCERLVGDNNEKHSIGTIDGGIKIEKMLCHTLSGDRINSECLECSIKDYCMNWCGCSNYFSTGYYNRVSPFLCASEKTSLKIAYKIIQILENIIGPTFYEHLGGFPIANSNV